LAAVGVAGHDQVVAVVGEGVQDPGSGEWVRPNRSAALGSGWPAISA